MSTLKSNTIEPATGTDLTLGASGDLIDVTSDALQLNTWKDSGGNTLFTSDGSGTLSSINSALDIGGGPNLILSQTATAAASVEFTSGIDSTYDKYMFVLINARNASNDNETLWFNCSTDGGSNYNVTKTTTYFDAEHGESNSPASLQIQAGHDRAQSTLYQSLCYETGNDADQCQAVILYLFAPSSTTYVKQFYSTGQYSSFDNESRNSYVSGYFNTTTAINAISFDYQVGTISGIFKMYGCR